MQKAMRDEANRHWHLVRAEQASGAREIIGATIFVHDSVRSSRGHITARLELATLCWAYHRQVTRWNLVPPIPVFRTHEVVLHARDGAGLTTWKQVSFYGTKREVRQSIAELMRRAPWACFGFAPDVRAAMSPGRRYETTREIEARRVGAQKADRTRERDEAAAAALDCERVTSFGIRGRD